MLRFLPSETVEKQPLLSQNKKKVSTIISYVSLGLHVVWVVLFIVIFMKPHAHERRLVEVNAPNSTSANWWTYDDTSKTLIIHADTVKIGHPTVLTSKRLLKASGTSKLVIHGAIESSSANIASDIMFHGFPIENIIQGAKGDTGPQGFKGDTGASGVQGEAGVKGEAGAPGVQGEAGAPGVQGEAGVKGDVGAPGVQGEAGVKGDAGEAGVKGDVGAQGAKGEAGASGSNGEQGAKGEAGASGSNGEQGAKGDAGETGEGVWWTYDKDLKQLNLLTDIVDTGTIIATEFNIKD